jgi:hypothetical protein
MRPVRPWRRALRLDLSFPSDVRFPVDFGWLVWWFDSAGDIGGSSALS